jgi:hypothetical protein
VRTPRGWVGRLDNHIKQTTQHVEVHPQPNRELLATADALLEARWAQRHAEALEDEAEDAREWHRNFGGRYRQASIFGDYADEPDEYVLDEELDLDDEVVHGRVIYSDQLDEEGWVAIDPYGADADDFEVAPPQGRVRQFKLPFKSPFDAERACPE